MPALNEATSRRSPDNECTLRSKMPSSNTFLERLGFINIMSHEHLAVLVVTLSLVALCALSCCCRYICRQTCGLSSIEPVGLSIPPPECDPPIQPVRYGIV
uniref:ORF6 n=1 Tax=Steinernema glaseri TaxID=37863 RepID=A0A1I7YG42_9BILA